MKARQNKLHIHMHENKKSFHFNTNPFGCIVSFCLTTFKGDYSFHQTSAEFCTNGQLAQSAPSNTRTSQTKYQIHGFILY